MAKITFNDIDTNRNGYLDRSEIQNAKSKGVKRELFIGMTALDLKNGVTKEQKVQAILASRKDDIEVFNAAGDMYPELSDGELVDKLLESDMSDKLFEKEDAKWRKQQQEEFEKNKPWYQKAFEKVADWIGCPGMKEQLSLQSVSLSCTPSYAATLTARQNKN